MAHDVADLAIVDALLHYADEGRGNPGFLEIGERLVADLAQIGAADVLQRLALHRIELQVDLEAGLECRKLLDERLVARDADAVGVEHGRGGSAWTWRA